MNQLFQIPREPEFQWTDISPTSIGFVKLKHLPSSAVVTVLNPAQIEAQLLFETPPVIEDVNVVIDSRLKQLQDQGYVFLDAYVCRFLLNNKNLFPSEWAEITDSESISEKSGSIRFDGSIFLSPDLNEVVLSPFCNRGKWGHGFSPNKYSTIEEKYFQSNPPFTKVYTAIIHRKFLDPK